MISFLGALTSSPLDVKKLVIKWLCITYPFTTKAAKQAYCRLYATVFYHIDNEELLPYVCHLLYLITTRQVGSSESIHV